MPGLTDDTLEAAIGEAFGDPIAPKAAPPAAQTADADPDPLMDGDAPEAEDAAGGEGTAPVGDEPEFEIEVDGAREIVRGKDAIKELLQKGRDYSQKSEVNARARDALQAQWAQQQLHAQFNQVILSDVAELRALDSQLEQYGQVDWAKVFDEDPFQAMKLKEQRDQIRERRYQKAGEIGEKERQFNAGQAEAAQKFIAAEQGALLAKLPEWRNSEKAQQDQTHIRSSLSAAGFNESEIANVRDHRMVIVALKAAKWDALQQGKAEKLKQVREAPPVVKPGASPTEKGKADSRKTVREYREMGRKGQSKAQEALLSKAFERAFK